MSESPLRTTHDLPADAEVDVIVVGAGSAGSAVASRLASAGHRVLLVEEGPAAAAVPEQLEDPDRLPSAEDPLVRREQVTTAGAGSVGATAASGTAARSAQLWRGRVLGGSSSVNGAYFVRPTDRDLQRWASVGGAVWAPANLAQVLCRIERDADFGDQPLHGDAGPVPVTRHAAPVQSVTEAFFAAAAAAGHLEQRDLNAGGSHGWGLVPRNIGPDGRRCSAATAYLGDARRPDELMVLTGSRVQRVLVQRGRAVGVELADAAGRVRELRAGEVVLSAGSVATPRLLFASGIGPADQLRGHQLEVVVDAAGLGRSGATHVAVDLAYVPAAASDPLHSPLLQGSLHLDAASGPAEVLAMCRPYGVASGDDPDDPSLSLRVSGLWPEPMGLEAAPDGVRLSVADPARCVAALREPVRRTMELVGRAEFAPAVASWLGPDPATVHDDRALDHWIAEHLTWSHHLCSTAPMGGASDPLAVVDPRGRVHGVEGLRVVDLSILPSPPTRGPAATAIAIGELLGDDPSA